MTIKEFALLCACNTQTLRYYDRIELLKPSRVDQWTGYRYYEREQALDFVKIKHLQSADFSIEEIKLLLMKPECEVYEAFDQKIAEQEQKLERIRQIQQSYLREKNAMEQIVQSVVDFMLAQVKDYELLREFGLDPEDGEAVLQKAKKYLMRGSKKHIPADAVQLTVGDKVYRGADEVSERIGLLSTEDTSRTILIGEEAVSGEEHFDAEQYESVLEKHGWDHVYEFIDEIPPLEEPDADIEMNGVHIRVETNRDFVFCFQLAKPSELDDMSFPMFLFGTVITKQNIKDVTMSCHVEPSKDGENHFVLMRRKKNFTISVS